MASVAYDLDRFAPKAAKPQEPEIKVLKQPKQHKKTAQKVRPVKSILSCAAIVIVFFAVMFSRAQYTELSAQVTDATSQLQELKSEETRLNLGIEGMVSMRRVEEYAQNQLGLMKAENYQTTYITLSRGDKVEITQTDENVFDYLARVVIGCFTGNYE